MYQRVVHLVGFVAPLLHVLDDLVLIGVHDVTGGSPTPANTNMIYVASATIVRLARILLRFTILQ